MGARRVSELIDKLPTVSNLTYKYDSKIQFDYKPNGSTFPMRINIYMPTRVDYEVTIDVVDKAIQNGANLIVFDNWIKSTIAAITYGERKNIKVYSFGNFLSKVQNGLHL